MLTGKKDTTQPSQCRDSRRKPAAVEGGVQAGKKTNPLELPARDQASSQIV